MSILHVENLTKSYGDKILFDDITFSINEKDRIGLIGVNGTGKSTLLKVLAGIDTSEHGKISHSKHFRMEYLSQNPDFPENTTVLDYIYHGDSDIMTAMREYEKALSNLEKDPNNEKKQQHLFSVQQKMDALSAWDANAVAKSVLNRLGITSYFENVTSLSGGQKKRVAIARALIQPADLLIMDEPTNHLDNETVEWLEEFLSQYQGALLLVTHDRYFLNRVTNKIFELDQGKLYIYEGNYELFLEKKAEREELAVSNEQKRQNTLRRELAWLKRGAKARTTKQKARIQRVEELQNQKGPKTQGKVNIALGASRLGKKVIELNSITKRMGDQTLIENFSYLLIPHDRIGIIGPNGSGKTTLLNMMAGLIQSDSGSIDIGETVKIGYYTQENVEMDESLRVIEYIKQVAEVVKTADGDTITAEQMLERFLFPRSEQWTYIHRLSGGERRRLYLLRILMSEPNVLFLDEPTNDLDIQTLSILEEYLETFPGVVVTVSHDRYFLDRVAEKLISFEGDRKIRTFLGSYSDYLNIRSEEKQAKEQEERQKEKQANKNKGKIAKKTKLSYKEQQEWDTIEDRISELEEKLTKIQEEMETFSSDSVKLQELFIEQQKVEKELEQAMERWEELSLLIEEIEQAKK
jgi:ABC transport system ATP-binding/permease protein